MFQPKPLVTALAFAFSGLAMAQQSTPTKVLDEVVVSDSRLRSQFTGQRLTAPQIEHLRAATSDTASLLTEVPGVGMYAAGGVSSLPVIHGLADDRLRVMIDGMDLVASCPNHMNPPLSYIDPTQIESLQVHAGVAPVSVAGDSIGGSIVVRSKEPVFAQPGAGLLTTGEAGTFYRSNGNAQGFNLNATLATENFSVSYSGATAQAQNYSAAKDFKTTTASGRPGHTLGLDEVGSSAYKTSNHSLGMAMRGGNHLFEVKLGYQDLPYQLYPNQRMDMLDNIAKRGSLRYAGQYDWGKLEARIYREEVQHFMDFGVDKQYSYGTLNNLSNAAIKYPVNGMPMYTSSATNGFTLQGDFNLNDTDLLRVGALLQTYRLNDWWPPAPDCGVGNCIGGMAPLTFWNINNGQRERKAVFAEWDAKWNAQWSSLVGLRVENVTTDSDDISGYNSMAVPGASMVSGMGIAMGTMYAGSSVGASPNGRTAFNALDRKRSDTNWDFSAMTSYRHDAGFNAQFGFARKTRSPNLYERYSWSTNTMAMVMNNFVGDGNGYVGNPDLKPEVAHTLSVSGDWHSADREYQLVVTPYFTRVNDYIDAKRTYPGSTAANATAVKSFVRLQYVNQEARLYGLDVAGKMPLAQGSMGQFGLRGQISYVNGENVDTGDGLYNIMPLTAKATLTHRYGGWNNALEVLGVQGKQDVSNVRNEIATGSYALLNLRTSYTWSTVRLDLGVENLLDRMYYLPTGGAYVGQGMTMSITGMPWGTVTPGMGRSLYAGLNVKF